MVSGEDCGWEGNRGSGHASRTHCGVSSPVRSTAAPVRGNIEQIAYGPTGISSILFFTFWMNYAHVAIDLIQYAHVCPVLCVCVCVHL